MFIYTFCVHNQPKIRKPAITLRREPRAPAKPAIRRASRADVGQISELVAQFSAQGLMLPRSAEQIAAKIDSYVVACDQGRVVACAALEEYSPSLAEVSSVAVAPSHHSQGLGTQVVLGVERLARARDIEEIFALSLSDNFFLGLSYEPTSISRYPEKLARYETLAKAGVEIVPKTCFQKVLGKAWSAPRLVGKHAARKAEKTRMVG
jgi:amino-acid N-acetyltransferase